MLRSQASMPHAPVHMLCRRMPHDVQALTCRCVLRTSSRRSRHMPAARRAPRRARGGTSAGGWARRGRPPCAPRAASAPAAASPHWPARPDLALRAYEEGLAAVGRLARRTLLLLQPLLLHIGLRGSDLALRAYRGACRGRPPCAPRAASAPAAAFPRWPAQPDLVLRGGKQDFPRLAALRVRHKFFHLQRGSSMRTEQSAAIAGWVARDDTSLTAPSPLHCTRCRAHVTACQAGTHAFMHCRCWYTATPTHPPRP